MDLQIAVLLGQDGLTTGAIYTLLALALVLVFSVTRIIFIPQGELVSFAALTLATLQAGLVPATLWLLVAGALTVALLDSLEALRQQQPWRLVRILGWNLGYPLALAALLHALPTEQFGLAGHILLTLALVVPFGPILYRLAYQPIADAPSLILLIVSVSVHMALVGFGLLIFGPEGNRVEPFSDARFEFGHLMISGQQLWVLGASALFITAIYLFFSRTLYGKALRATAINRNGARLMGFSPILAGKLSFFLAALIGAISGILIAPVTTIYYDTGFLMALKGFVAAIIGGLVSFPLAAAGAMLVGLLESFASFGASAYKEVLVFTLIIPVLLWRSLASRHTLEEEE